MKSRFLILFLALAFFPLTGRGADNSIAGPKLDPSNRSQVPWRTTDDGSGNQSLHVVVDSGGGGGGGAATIADGADITQGAKADAKSPATDTTPISVVSILKQISASVQAPPSQAVTGPVTDAQLRATAVPTSVQIAKGATNYANGQVTATGTAATLVAARATRRSVLVRNLDASLDVYVGNATVTAGNGMLLKAGESFPIDAVGLIEVIAPSGSPVVAYMETYD